MKTYDQFLKLLEDKEITFNRRPIKFHATLSLQWRISALLLFLKSYCTKEQASLQKLHVFYSHVGQDTELKHLVECLMGNSNLYNSKLQFDTTLLRAISFMVAYRFLIKLPGGKFQLTDIGRAEADKIINDPKILEETKNILKLASKKAYSEASFQRCVNGGLL